MNCVNSYSLQTPSVIRFGAGCRNELATVLPPDARIILAAGNSAVRSGAAAGLQNILQDFPVRLYGGIAPEPTTTAIDELRRALREFRADTVIAVGGGSVMDTAKAAAAMGNESAPAVDFFYRRTAFTRPGLRIIALPTTAGTGAEVTANGVFTDPATGIKQSIRGGDRLLPMAAFVDPELTWSCPAGVTFASGMDALTQCVEAVIGRKAGHATRPLAVEGAKLLFSALPRLNNDLNDHEARSDAAEGTLLGAIAFASSGLGAVHGLAHPLGARYHVPHGAICALLLPKVLEWNRSAAAETMTELALACGYADAAAMIAAIREMLVRFHLPTALREYGAKREDFAAVAANSRSGSMKNNPREMSDAELIRLLEEVF